MTDLATDLKTIAGKSSVMHHQSCHLVTNLEAVVYMYTENRYRLYTENGDWSNMRKNPMHV